MSQQPAARTVKVSRGALVLEARALVDDIYGDVGRPQGGVAIHVTPSWNAPEMDILLPLDWESFDEDELLAHLHSQPQLTTLLREVVVT